MTDGPLQGTELKKFVKLAMKAPLPFAYNPGKKPEEHFFDMARKGTPAMLGKAVKEDGPGNKVAFGTCFVEKKVMQLSCERVLPTMAKGVKKYLQLNKVKLNVVIMDASGNVLDEDIEDLSNEPGLEDEDGDSAAAGAGGDGGGPPGGPPDGPGPDKGPSDPSEGFDVKALVARLKAARAAIALLEDPAKSRLAEAAEGVTADLQARAFAQAEAGLTRIESALARLAQQAQSDGQEWAQLSPPFVQDVAAALANGLGNIAKIDELWAYAQAKAGAEDFKNALKALPPLRKFLDDAAALADETARTIAEDQNDLLAVWTQEEAELGPMVARAETDFPAAFGALQKAWETAGESAGKGDFAAALAKAQKLRSALTKLEQQAALARQEEANVDTATGESLETAFAQFSKLRDEARAALATLPNDHDAFGALAATLAQLDALTRDAGFDADAVKAIGDAQTLIAAIAAEGARVKQAKDALKAKFDETAKAPDGASMEQLLLIAKVSGEGRATLAADIPSKADFDQAREKLVELKEVIERLKLQISAAEELRTALEVARTAIESLPADQPATIGLSEAYDRVKAVLDNPAYSGLYAPEFAEAGSFPGRVDAAKAALRKEKQEVLALLEAAALLPVGHLPEEKKAVDGLLTQAKAELPSELPMALEIVNARSFIPYLESETAKSRTRLTLAALPLVDGSETAKATAAILQQLEQANKGAETTQKAITAKKEETLKAAAEYAAIRAQSAPPATPEDYAAAKAAYEKLYWEQEGLVGQKALLEGLAPGGALSETGPLALDEGTRVKFINALYNCPSLAVVALENCKGTKNAAEVVDRLPGFGALLMNEAIGYYDPSHSSAHVEVLIAAGAKEGGAYLDEAYGYISQQFPLTDAAMAADSQDTWPQLGTRRSAAMADALLNGPGDPYDVTSPEFQSALGHLKFGYSALIDRTPSHTAHVVETANFLALQETQEALKTCVAPSGKGKELISDLMKQVEGDSWVAPEPMKADLTKKALLIALMTPIEQGSVGSCFATAGLISLRKEDPKRALALYKEALEKGTFTPLRQAGDKMPAQPIPLVTKRTKGDNPITRAIEYSAATAASATQTSANLIYKNDQVDEAMRKTVIVDGLKMVLGDDADLPAKVQKLGDALKKRITFEYNAQAPLPETSADGNSGFGTYVALVDGASIHNADFAKGRANFVDAAYHVALDVFSDQITDFAAQGLLLAFLDNDAFTDSFVYTDFEGKKTAIWQMAFGGPADETNRVLLDITSEHTNVVAAEANPKSKAEGERTLSVVKGLMGLFDGETKNISLTTAGQHVFNGLPDHASQTPIRGKPDKDIEAFFDTMGKTVTDLVLPKSQASDMFDAALAAALASVPKAHEGLAKAALETKRPAADMKTAALSTAVAEAKSAIWDAVTKALTSGEIDTWAKAKGGEMATKSEADKKAAYEKELRKTPSANDIRASIAAAIPMPDPVVIADTNWGNGTEHQVFAIAPDPATGEPIMWIRSEPSGHMTPAGRDWVDRGWIKTAPRPAPPVPPKTKP